MDALQATTYAVDPRTCIRCAACATIAPANFAVRVGPAKLLRNPQTPRERRACAASAAICPTQAISATGEAEADSAPQPPSPKVPDLYPPVMEVAEGVRWKISDLPWASFDPSAATPALRAVVREMAYSEQTTFSATQRFMEAFAENTDFTQWISVWFYEETRHPMALLRWLALAGETPDGDFVTKGRVSAPFMKSLTGTLVTNVISEMVAAEAYLSLARGAEEPLLTAIVQRIGADEARHGSSFFTYARSLLETSAQPDRERLDAIKVLHFWLNASKNVNHPVNEVMEKLKPLMAAMGAPVFVPPTDRISKVIGCLIGLPIQTPADVGAHLLEHTKRMHAAPTAPALGSA